MKCRYLSDDFNEICVNAESPACADFCPCVNYPEICKYSTMVVDANNGAEKS